MARWCCCGEPAPDHEIRTCEAHPISLGVCWRCGFYVHKEGVTIVEEGT